VNTLRMVCILHSRKKTWFLDFFQRLVLQKENSSENTYVFLLRSKVGVLPTQLALTDLSNGHNSKYQATHKTHNPSNSKLYIYGTTVNDVNQARKINTECYHYPVLCQLLQPPSSVTTHTLSSFSPLLSYFIPTNASNISIT
jgi:hypothetical protein